MGGCRTCTHTNNARTPELSELQYCQRVPLQGPPSTPVLHQNIALVGLQDINSVLRPKNGFHPWVALSVGVGFSPGLPSPLSTVTPILRDPGSRCQQILGSAGCPLPLTHGPSSPRTRLACRTPEHPNTYQLLFYSRRGMRSQLHTRALAGQELQHCRKGRRHPTQPQQQPRGKLSLASVVLGLGVLECSGVFDVASERSGGPTGS